MGYKTPELSWVDARTACENEGYCVGYATFKTKEAAQSIIDDYQNAFEDSKCVNSKNN